jgi:hypothetical protein
MTTKVLVCGGRDYDDYSRVLDIGIAFPGGSGKNIPVPCVDFNVDTVS